MNFINQQEAIESLKILSTNRHHGVVISGTKGSGKSYLAKKYSEMLNVEDFYPVNPSMSDIKAVITLCTEATNDIVLCIENLDNGVLQVAYPLLKFIEDCPKNIYVVVTCLNIRQIPDTILSRCALVSINNPVADDIERYAKSIDLNMYNNLKDTPLWRCVRNLNDVDTLIKLSPEHLAYFDTIRSLVDFKGTVSTIAWKLQNYEDKTPTPISLVIRYIMQLINTTRCNNVCIKCLDALENSRMPQNAIITRFVFENKYCE